MHAPPVPRITVLYATPLGLLALYAIKDITLMMSKFKFFKIFLVKNALYVKVLAPIAPRKALAMNALQLGL